LKNFALLRFLIAQKVFSEIFQRIIAKKVFFLILFFQKKRMPAWQGTQSK